MGVESRAVRSSSSRDVSSHSATGSTESAFASANSTYLSVANADLIFRGALLTSLVDSPRLKRVIELSKLVLSSYRIPDRKAMNGTYLPEAYATRARKRDTRPLEFATISCLVCLISSIYLLL